MRKSSTGILLFFLLKWIAPDFQRIILEEYQHSGAWKKSCSVQHAGFADQPEAVRVLSGELPVLFPVAEAASAISLVRAVSLSQDQIIPEG